MDIYVPPLPSDLVISAEHQGANVPGINGTSKAAESFDEPVMDANTQFAADCVRRGAHVSHTPICSVSFSAQEHTSFQEVIMGNIF
jgi:hypothetical protein